MSFFPTDLLACRYINDEHYYGGFEQEELNQLFDAMQSNFRAWVTGFAPLAVGADLKSTAVKEFTRTFFSIRPDIALCISKTCFQSDLRSILPQVIPKQLLFYCFSTLLSYISSKAYVLHTNNSKSR